MKKLNKHILWLLSFIYLFFMAGCTSDSSENFVASVGNKDITIDEFKKHLDHLPKSFVNLGKTEILDKMLAKEVLYASAIKEGYDKDPELVDTFRRLITQKFLRDKLDPLINQIIVTEDEIKTYYNSHTQAFSTSQMVRAAIIQIKVPALVSDEKKNRFIQKAKEARKEALLLPSHIHSFGSIAIKFSDDQSSRYRGGDTGWIKTNAIRSRWENKVLQKMAVLTQGAISSVIDGEKGYYVIKVIDRKEPEVKPLSKVQNKIRHQLMVIKKKQVRDKFYTTLKKNINVSVNDTALARVKLSGKKSDNKIPPKLPEQ